MNILCCPLLPALAKLSVRASISTSAASSPLAVAQLAAGKTWDVFPDRKTHVVTGELIVSFLFLL